MALLIRLLVNVAALWVAVRFVPGVTWSGDWTGLVLVALVFGVVNAFVRPVLLLLTLPLQVVTLGLFTLIVNGFMLWLTSALAGQLELGFHVDGCLPAILGALVVSVVSLLLSIVMPDPSPRPPRQG